MMERSWCVTADLAWHENAVTESPLLVNLYFCGRTPLFHGVKIEAAEDIMVFG